MADELTIITNNVPRDIMYEYELTGKEREEFDYLKGQAMIDASFFRYKGEIYDLGEFTVPYESSPDILKSWDGYLSDSFFSGIVVRYVENGEAVVVGRYYG